MRINTGCFFPRIDSAYSRETFLTILVLQICIGYIISSTFLCKWNKMRDMCITESDARKLNSLLLGHAMARCSCRFGIVALIILVYAYYVNIDCVGYTPSRGCKVDTQGTCTQLMYSICACFYYTSAASKLIYTSKHTPINRDSVVVLFRCIVVVILSAALIYGVSTSASAAVVESDGNFTSALS